MVAAELAQQTSLEAVAQSVVDRVKRLHHDVYVSGRQRAAYCSRHEDMTLLIRTLNYPLADGAVTPTQGKKGHSVIGLLFDHCSGNRPPHQPNHDSYSFKTYKVLEVCGSILVKIRENVEKSCFPNILACNHLKQSQLTQLVIAYIFFMNYDFFYLNIFRGLER